MVSLQDFLSAQDPVIATVLQELRAGRKRSHWMWFVFPQITGLGFSAMSQRFAIASLEEARSYLAHPLLGARLKECTAAALTHVTGEGVRRSAHDIFGSPDDLKFRSSMTLFHRAAPEEPLFGTALDAFFHGREDEATLARLYAQNGR